MMQVRGKGRIRGAWTPWCIDACFFLPVADVGRFRSSSATSSSVRIGQDSFSKLWMLLQHTLQYGHFQNDAGRYVSYSPNTRTNVYVVLVGWSCCECAL